jgi:predicted GNAT family acetyltransferase
MHEHAAAALVSDAPERSRFEVYLGRELAGFADYQRRGDFLAFVHTEMDERFAGKGIAGELIAFALDTARREGLTVLTFCPFGRLRWR